MTYSTEYGDIGPYCLKDKEGRIMENIWQCAKVCPKVPHSLQRYSRYNKRVIWDHQAEVHIGDDGEPNELYWKWREN